MSMERYSIKRTVAYGYEEALEKVTAALAEEGFGVLTEIDVAATLKKKIGVDFRPYKILGACNPPLAHRALTAEIDVGLLLPCNVVVYTGDDGKTVVAAIDPEEALGPAGGDDLKAVAGEVKAKLVNVMERL